MPAEDRREAGAGKPGAGRGAHRGGGFDGPDGDVLLTGFPDFVAERIGRQVLQDWPGVRLLVLHRDQEAALGRFVSQLAPADRARVVPLHGHVCHMDLGLTAEAYGALRDRVRVILHAASAYRAEGPGYGLRRVNVDGTREVLELAAQCADLHRLVHLSTVRVSGCRQGVVLEAELEAGQRFHSPYEQTRYEAERLVRRAGRSLPITVVRPGIVVGDSRTGEIRPYEGPWDLLERFLLAPRRQAVLLPGSGSAPVHLVPVDHVARAVAYLGAAEDAVGQTYHVVDPAPLPARKVCEWVARKAHRQPAQRAVPRLISRAMRAHRRVARLNPFPVAPPEIFDQMVLYNAQHALQALGGAGITCPPFPRYVERLVGYLQQQQTAAGPREELPHDPLA